MPLYLLSEERFFLSLTYFGLMINLFNLLPIRPLDGGRITAALSPWLWGIGLLLMLISIFTIAPNPLMILILLFGLSDFYKWWKGENRHYFEISRHKRILFAFGYLGLIFVLVLSLSNIHSQLG
ncbi:MAG: hypothetical protein IV090_17920 [Candidatus Sericytochromatia bacterium]|nr:hypothetical protein [Candidatus Sericytochromatia bacterium]